MKKHTASVLLGLVVSTFLSPLFAEETKDYASLSTGQMFNEILQVQGEDYYTLANLIAKQTDALAFLESKTKSTDTLEKILSAVLLERMQFPQRYADYDLLIEYLDYQALNKDKLHRGYSPDRNIKFFLRTDFTEMDTSKLLEPNWPAKVFTILEDTKKSEAVLFLSETVLKQKDYLKTFGILRLGKMEHEIIMPLFEYIINIPVPKKEFRDPFGPMSSPLKPEESDSQDYHFIGCKYYLTSLLSYKPELAPLMKKLIDQGVHTRPVIWALGLAKHKDSIPMLIDILKTNPSQHYRKEAAEALGRMETDDPSVLTALVESLSDEDVHVRKAAAIGIGKNNKDLLLSLLSEHEEKSLNHALIRAVQDLNITESLPILIEKLNKNENEWVRYYIVSTFEDFKDRKTIGILNDIVINDKYERVREQAVKTLGHFCDPTSVRPLIYSLNDKNTYIRSNAAKILGKIGDPAAVPGLIQKLDDEHPNVYKEAASALRRIGDPRALEPLRQRKEKLGTYGENAIRAIESRHGLINQ